MRAAFYDSESVQRSYFGKLSRTYALLFSLKSEPKIIEYFEGMTAQFRPYIGADIIIRALSEHYLPKADQMTTNLLELLMAAGSHLILSQPVAEEIWNHFIVTDNEYHHHVRPIERHMTWEVATQAPKIMLRAYLYAKLNEGPMQNRPRNWESFVGQFCTYRTLHQARAMEELTLYLLERFGVVYERADEITEFFDSKDLDKLTEEYFPHKQRRHKDPEKARLLASNDAKMTLAVYGRRRHFKEYSPNPYGFRTWWLTEETVVQHIAKWVIAENSGHRFIIRPDFLLNFIALSPSTEEVRHSFANVFPTLLGIRLSNRIRPCVFDDLMDKIKKTDEVDEVRANVMMRELSDLLKQDESKQYDTRLVD